MREAGPSALHTYKETIESLIIAFILAFVFRAFVVEAFVIPTGSMANTLLGAHYRLTCPTCGNNYKFNFTPGEHGLAEGQIPARANPILGNNSYRGVEPMCPLCGTKIDGQESYFVSNGDRILVLKYLYQVSEPKIWDVVVFKNPEDPSKNFIKRLIGVPGNEVHIIDGDIYINGQIQRKPEHVQDELWIKVFDNDYQPVVMNTRHDMKWHQPFTPETGPASQENPAMAGEPAWTIDPDEREYRFSGSAQTEDMTFNAKRLQYLLQTFLDYNGPETNFLDFVSDLKLDALLVPEGETGELQLTLGKYGREYQAQIKRDGACRIVRLGQNESEEAEVLAEGTLPPLVGGKPVYVAFCNLDHTLQLTVGAKTLFFDGPSEPVAWDFSEQKRLRIATVRIGSRGDALRLQHVRLFRDIQYTNRPESVSGGDGRATERSGPFKLHEDEFFVLGDNSAASHDSRFWREMGRDIVNREVYREGIVPRDYMIGKAFFVYWPAGFRATPNMRFAVIPNVGDMRFIH